MLHRHLQPGWLHVLPTTGGGCGSQNPPSLTRAMWSSACNGVKLPVVWERNWDGFDGTGSSSQPAPPTSSFPGVSVGSQEEVSESLQKTWTHGRVGVLRRTNTKGKKVLSCVERSRLPGQTGSDPSESQSVPTTIEKHLPPISSSPLRRSPG